ncbi:hypothetical protein DFP72DRAFT_1174285 [Ephemerocybe angulata]|uniref:Uncharacterized protein n=1 Tax=Ephemerocybe angulata TaxID=980116 RepID=A0A8H6HLF5_9AGAR|nr:hypothetical protein DFP72DRAFT_1174285 [Tulosesus angulatus]
MPEFTVARSEIGLHLPHRTPSPRTQAAIEKKLEEMEKAEAERHAHGHMRENQETVKDPLARAQNHMHEPSRGAKVDAELMHEELEELKRKGKLNVYEIQQNFRDPLFRVRNPDIMREEMEEELKAKGKLD